jgi:predicted acylesterase/phospholipase RssA
MKGGGIKGLAYVGAITELQNRYNFDWYLGTSAGAISAVLLAAGYSCDELKVILVNKNFAEFFDSPLRNVPMNLWFYKGCYRAQAFTDWLDTLLAEKLDSPTRVKLSDLPKRVTVFASRRHKSVLTFDPQLNDVEAAYAARCSMSIPFLFTPQFEQGLRTYDGGILNNYPVDRLLEISPNTPFIALYLGSETYEPIKSGSVLLDLASIVLESREAELLVEHRDSTVIIDPRPVGTLDFGLTNNEKAFLLACGKAGALRYLAKGSTAHKRAKEDREVLKESVAKIRSEKARKAIIICLFVFVAILGSCYAGYRYLKWKHDLRQQEIAERLDAPIPPELLPNATKEPQFPAPNQISESSIRNLTGVVLYYRNVTDGPLRLLLCDCAEASRSPTNARFRRSPFLEIPMASRPNAPTARFKPFTKFPKSANWFVVYAYDPLEETTTLLGTWDLTAHREWRLTVKTMNKTLVCEMTPHGNRQHE